MQNQKTLQSVLVSDKHFVPKNVEEILKSEVFKTLLNYLEIKPENAKANFDVAEDGDFLFFFKVKAKRLKIMGILPQEV